MFMPWLLFYSATCFQTLSCQTQLALNYIEQKKQKATDYNILEDAV